jgi:hypothetical protein
VQACCRRQAGSSRMLCKSCVLCAELENFLSLLFRAQLSLVLNFSKVQGAFIPHILKSASSEYPGGMTKVVEVEVTSTDVSTSTSLSTSTGVCHAPPPDAPRHPPGRSGPDNTDSRPGYTPRYFSRLTTTISIGPVSILIVFWSCF